MKKWFGNITLNVVFRIVVGKRFDAATSGDGSEEDDQCRKALREFFELAASFVASDAIPWLRWLDLGGNEKIMRKTAKELDEYAEKWLEEHKKKRSSGQLQKADLDFMDVMLSILEDAQEIPRNYDTDTINKATCLVSTLLFTK